MPVRLLLASTNPAKREKLRWLLADCEVEPAEPAGVDLPRTDESGRTFLENAREKARAASRAFGGLALASDGGLAIPALGARWDRLRTGRFAGPAATDESRIEALLYLMKPFQADERACFWTEAAAIADRGEILKGWGARSPDGRIAESFDRSKIVPGFWAFSLWYLPQFARTYVDLREDELARLEDHWLRLREQVRAYFSLGPSRRPQEAE